MKKLSIIAVLLLAFQMHAQQDPQYTQYMYNMNVINPAYAGSRENLSLGLLYRNQWASGLEGSPETGTFFGHTPVSDNLGLGLSAISDRIGPVKETNLYADVSYTIDLGRNSHLAFGIKAGATFHDIGLAGIDLIDAGDPFFQDISSVTPNIGAGLFYYTDNYYVSLSMPNFLSAVHLDDNGTKIGSETQHYFLTGGYVFDLSRNTELKPSLMVKSSFNAPVSFDVNVNARFYKKFEIGVSYRLEDSFSGLVNFALSDAVRIGYAYDSITSGIRTYSLASHELMLLFDLNFSRRVSRSPRYF